MKSTESFILRKHRLRHFSPLKVERGFLDKKFSAGCSMFHCNARCCRHGVMVDPVERERILSHSRLVQQQMEPHQDKNPDGWFDDVDEADLDFPSGRAVGTQTRSYGCVFLDSGGKCVLQKAATEEGMPKFALKPFYCVAFPISIEDGVLLTDDPEFTHREECCSTVQNGEKTVLDVCSEELEFILGKEGLEELKSSRSDNG